MTWASLDYSALTKASYTGSHALIIGIDKYQNMQPLSHAVSDARGFRNVLVDEFNFPAENVRELFDYDATLMSIRQAFYSLAQDATNLDDRLIVFFAGHGETKPGVRREFGYLCPTDAHPTCTETLLGWDELITNVDQIKAKHVLFIMDACFSGLALHRSAGAGAARYIKDLVKRPSVQVITAGKADQKVADSGGPISGHSLFTGHLITGLQGEAKTDLGLITASGVMHYVFSRVGGDAKSNQTPHYGQVVGDGDFVFNDELLKQFETTSGTDPNALVSLAPPRWNDPRETADPIKRIQTLAVRRQPVNRAARCGHDRGARLRRPNV